MRSCDVDIFKFVQFPCPGRKVATYERLEISIDSADSWLAGWVMNYTELCDICSGQQEIEINIDIIINNKLQTQ